MQKILDYIKITPIVRTHGVTEKKKAELDALIIEVLDAQHDVDQYQAMVDSLLEKSMKFQVYLSDADSDRAKTLSNRNMVDSLLQSVIDLYGNSKIANTEATDADARTKALATQINTVVNKLIYSADIIKKLGNLVVRRKAQNPLISDELVSILSTVGSDVNNAVALSLVALRSVFAAQASAIETHQGSDLEFKQSVTLYELLTGHDIRDIDNRKNDQEISDNGSLYGKLYKAYEDAKKHYEETHKGYTMTMQQLNHAQVHLNKAQTKLKSLQSGLSAGNAAALSS